MSLGALTRYIKNYVYIVYLYPFAIPENKAYEELLGLSDKYLRLALKWQQEAIEETSDLYKKQQLERGLELIKKVMRAKGIEV